MAREDRSPLEPERRFAQEFLRARALSPPVDVLSLLREQAEVSWADIPVRCEAVLVRGAGRRARVLIQASARSHPERQRFTLAHELAHLVLPWQPGTVFCHAESETVSTHDLVAERMEAEANRFASELLVPTAWTQNQLSRLVGPFAERAVRITETTNVSFSVSLRAIARACPTPLLIVRTNAAGIVWEAFSSSNASCGVPENGERFVKSAYGAGQVSEVAIGTARIVAIEFPLEVRVPASKPTRDSRSILREIVDTTAPSQDHANEAYKSIMGVLGAINGSTSAKGQPGRILAAARMRFCADARLEPFVSHPSFETFLEARAMELAVPSNRRR